MWASLVLVVLALVGCSGGAGGSSESGALRRTGSTAGDGASDGTVRWGIKVFRNKNACGGSAGRAVGIAPSNAAAVGDSIARTEPGGTTSTRDAITYGTTYLQSLTDT